MTQHCSVSTIRGNGDASHDTGLYHDGRHILRMGLLIMMSQLCMWSASSMLSTTGTLHAQRAVHSTTAYSYHRATRRELGIAMA